MTALRLILGDQLSTSISSLGETNRDDIVLIPKQTLEHEIDNNLGLASVGDWCGSARIEDVWLKARKCAAQLSSEVDGT